MTDKVPHISVLPSGSDVATALPPSVEPAPGRFSTTTGWPSRACICWPTKRAMVSIGPPAATVTMILIGLSG